MKASSFFLFNKPEPRLGIEFSAIEFPAAFETGDRALDAPNPWKFLAATRTTIEEAPRALFHGKGQGVATRFVCDAEIAAGAAPFRAMRRDAPASGAELREQMRQLMAQGAIDFAVVAIAKPGI